MHGPGRYDDLCTTVRLISGARCVAMIVIDGNKGPGFAVQGTRDCLLRLPMALQNMAAAIEADLHTLDTDGMSR